jgi:L-rhamnonate dehydratase
MARMKANLLPGAGRREFLRTAGGAAVGLAVCRSTGRAAEAAPPKVTIADVTIADGVAITATNGVKGFFKKSENAGLAKLGPHLARIRGLLVGRDPLDRALDGEMLWEAVYPGQAKRFAEGRDPLTGESILNKPRAARHTDAGAVFIGFSNVDNALWDLRGKLLGRPAYRVIGTAGRERVRVYWRPGEARKGLAEARREAREAFDRGYRLQKWYFNKGAKDGPAGLKENIELARVLREELPDADLMFDNHSIRYEADVDYSVRLCKAVAAFKPYWIEEPICPEHVEGYARIKGETGLTIAGGEHWYTRWPVRMFLERKCVDVVQSDPIWCGGISEWLRICDLVKSYPGVRVVPHITSPWLAAPHCVASQPEALCPLLEFNYEGGRQALEGAMARLPDGGMAMTMPSAPGLS